jgi:hypothetical protein
VTLTSLRPVGWARVVAGFAWVTLPLAQLERNMFSCLVPALTRGGLGILFGRLMAPCPAWFTTQASRSASRVVAGFAWVTLTSLRPVGWARVVAGFAWVTLPLLPRLLPRPASVAAAQARFRGCCSGPLRWPRRRSCCSGRSVLRVSRLAFCRALLPGSAPFAEMAHNAVLMCVNTRPWRDCDAGFPAATWVSNVAQLPQELRALVVDWGAQPEDLWGAAYPNKHDRVTVRSRGHDRTTSH